MRPLYPNQLLYLHKRVIETSGGSPGVRDQGLMESAVYRPQAAFAGEDLYPDLFSKAAALGHSILKNHPFIDGNKRTAYEAMRLTLRLNGYNLRVGENEAFEVVMAAAAGTGLDEHGLAAWLRKSSRKTK